jgi:hypothetical protein
MTIIDLPAWSYFIDFLILGEKYARFIESSTLMGVFPAFLIGLLSAHIRLFAMTICFLCQRTLFPGAPFLNNPHSC